MIKFDSMTEAEKTALETSSTESETIGSGSLFVTGSSIYCTDSSKLWIYTGHSWKSTTLE
tara:strand:+ start:1896 stop:2075 length:180 start_codon:yes stop_codon:yes gene_type:complete